MVHLIQEAGKNAVQRDALYNVVKEYRRDAPGLLAAAS